MNEYHDPNSGRFTSGGSSRSFRTIASSEDLNSDTFVPVHMRKGLGSRPKNLKFHAVAVKTEEGRLIVGQPGEMHFDVMDKLTESEMKHWEKSGQHAVDEHEGFVTAGGRFVKRNVATRAFKRKPMKVLGEVMPFVADSAILYELNLLKRK